MKNVKRILSVVLLIVLMMSVCSTFAMPVSAATGKSRKYDVFATKTIVVTTEKKGSPYITFKSTGDGTSSYGAKAPILSLKVFNHKTGKTQFYRVTGARWIGSSVSSKLKLDRNTKYTITVSYLYDRKLNWGTYGTGLCQRTGWFQGLWQITSSSRLSYTIK